MDHADDIEQAARIVEAFSEGVDADDEKTSQLLANIAKAIRDRAFND